MENNSTQPDQAIENFKQKLVEEFKSQGIHTLADLRKVIDQRNTNLDFNETVSSEESAPHNAPNKFFANTSMSLSNFQQPHANSKPTSFVEIMKRK